MADDKHLDLSKLGAALPNIASGLSSQDRAGLVNALKDKLQSLAHKDLMEHLGPKVKKRVEALKEIQREHDEFEANFFAERAVLEAKYQKLYQPLYVKRYEIVNGVVEVDGVAKENSEDTTAEESTEEKGVPAFWLTAMKTNEVVAEEIQEKDEEALKFLNDIKWTRLDDPKGFKLDFFFDSNPFFKNSVLRKTYHMIDDNEPILEKAIGTEIEWLPGKCLTQKTMKKKPKKGSKNSKPVIKTETCESFFNFFNPPQVPEDEDIDEDTADELQNQMEQDYDVGSTIRDKIIPHAVSWFTGEAAQDDFGEFVEGEEGEEDDEDEDEEETDDEEEDDEDDEDSKTKKKSAVTKKKGGDELQVDRPPECKQQ